MTLIWEVGPVGVAEGLAGDGREGTVLGWSVLTTGGVCMPIGTVLVPGNGILERISGPVDGACGLGVIRVL